MSNLIRRMAENWAEPRAKKLIALWRNRAIALNARVARLKDELAAAQAATAEEIRRADAWKREAGGKASKLLQANRDLDTTRKALAFQEDRNQRLTNEVNRLRHEAHLDGRPSLIEVVSQEVQP